MQVKRVIATATDEQEEQSSIYCWNPSMDLLIRATQKQLAEIL